MSDVRYATAALALAASTAAAQSPKDSTARPLDPVVVTAGRSEAPLASSSAAVTRLSANDLRRLPLRTVADALQYVPGMIVLQGDGMGFAPRPIVRGFYGGGETEYVTVLVDGVPVSQLATGQVNWDLVPLAAIDAIEVVRGGASSLYGDAAVGGVVNLVTRRDHPFARWRLAGGSFGQAQGGGALGGSLGGHQASAFADVRRATGYRAHEKRDAISAGGSVALTTDTARTLTLSTLNSWRSFDEPGPLAGTDVASDRRAAAPFYKFDNTDEELHRLALAGATPLGSMRLTGHVTGEYVTADAIRTLPLSAAFADTKDRRTYTSRALASLQLESSPAIGSPSHLVVGTDLTTGHLGTTYRNMVTGPASAYTASSGTVGAIDAKGLGSRTSAAAFATWELAPTDPLRITLGARGDWIDDRYEPRAPSKGNVVTANRAAFSPRFGANLRWLSSATQQGNVYATAGRSFKAPTMDQLFDQRHTPVPFPPYSISTSNADLEAQYGTSIEGGAYHRVSLVPGRFDLRATVSAYQTDMTNELDFDIESFKYVNIGKSRHRGIEAGLNLDGPNGFGTFTTWALQHATSRLGDDAGKYLKAIPRQALTAGISRAASTGLTGSLGVTAIGPTYLNDANTIRLPGHAQLDLRAAYPVAHTRVTLDVRNLLGQEYSSTGFPDPAGSATTLYYPAAGRVVTVGLDMGW